MNSIFTEKAWSEYLYWQNEDKKTLKRINLLLTDIQRNGPGARLGKAEILKGRRGYSKRIDDKNRLVYEFNNEVEQNYFLKENIISFIFFQILLNHCSSFISISCVVLIELLSFFTTSVFSLNKLSGLYFSRNSYSSLFNLSCSSFNNLSRSSLDIR